MINEKNLDKEIVNKNIEKVISLIFFSTIFEGKVVGILNFTGFLGLGFYLLNFLVVIALFYFIILHFQKKKGNFSNSILSLLFQGLVNHGMTYN